MEYGKEPGKRLCIYSRGPPERDRESAINRWPNAPPSPSRDRPLRDLLRLRQRGMFGLDRPAGVQQRLRIGAVGDPEVALTLHPVGEHRPRAGPDPAPQRRVYRARAVRISQSILSGAWGSSPSPRTTIAAPSRARVIVQCAIGDYGADGPISVCKSG